MVIINYIKTTNVENARASLLVQSSGIHIGFFLEVVNQAGMPYSTYLTHKYDILTLAKFYLPIQQRKIAPEQHINGSALCYIFMSPVSKDIMSLVDVVESTDTDNPSKNEHQRLSNCSAQWKECFYSIYFAYICIIFSELLTLLNAHPGQNV